jgi:hypothetical protein
MASSISYPGYFILIIRCVAFGESTTTRMTRVTRIWWRGFV